MRSHQKLLYAAIDDIGEAVRGNDAKAYAALVLHGLLLTAVATLLVKLGGVYEHASLLERVLGLVFLGITLGTFLSSAWFLISALTPYRPIELDARLKPHYRHVFFPSSDLLAGASPHEVMTERMESMDDRMVRDVLVAETLKLTDILQTESRHTGRGLSLLRIELLAASGFFVVVAFSVL